ncbi:HD domain-containing phosphohydrolase [Deinococcus yavapaiensis]|uniref:HD domain-containing phosphohydrolase n=1 Tax=Deinococcus yavapaiensis TaxID=309889 RepID=UPI0014740026|nr:HD domain-containing phosphohydrolase [Deinococcus yavapaiensis]
MIVVLLIVAFAVLARWVDVSAGGFAPLGPAYITLGFALLIAATGLTMIRLGPTRSMRLWLAVLLGGLSGVAFERAFVGGSPALQFLLLLVVTSSVILTWIVGHREVHKRDVARDPLTNLLTREGLTRAYETLPIGTPCGVVMLDLNDLKTVNDIGGHSAGDAHILGVARAIRAAFPGFALVSRWGGDEFLVLVPQAPSERIMKWVKAALAAAPAPTPGVPAFAFGLAEACSPEPLLRAVAVADQDMYDMKSRKYTPGGRDVSWGVEDVVRLLQNLDTVQDLLGEGLEAVRALLGFEGSAVWRVRGDFLTLVEVYGAPSTNVRSASDALRRLEVRLSRGGGVFMPLLSGSTVAVADFTSVRVDREAGALAELQRHGLKSILVAPVHARSEVEWLLTVFSFDTWRTITPQARRVMEVLALRVSHVLERDRVVRLVRETLEGGLLGLGVALEARALEMAGHTDRVVARAQRVGEAMGLSLSQLGELRQGAYLHDIGKLAVPDSVLLKPGPLTSDETAVMRTHAQRGAEIASRIPGLTLGALEVILHHHERWDGSGYPHGLSDDEIPLLARIFAVVDVYDALTSERVYKKAWSSTEAIEELKRQAGCQFDPAVVDAFVKLTAPERAN